MSQMNNEGYGMIPKIRVIRKKNLKVVLKNFC